MDDHRPIEDKVLEFLSTLHDNHEIGDQRWIRTLLDHGVNNTTSEIVELGAMIQTTVMDMLLGKLLGINPTVLAKASLVEDYIGEIWEHNNLEKQSLYNFILDNPDQREAILQLIQSKTDIEPNLSPSIEQPVEGGNAMVTQIKDMAQESNQQDQQPILTTPMATTITMNQNESDIQEITMEEAEIVQIQMPENISNVIAHDIKEVPEYSIRNRVSQPTNPFFITKKGTFMAGILMANVPGEDKEERTNYLAHLFRLAKEEKHLIGSTFSNGNNWFTVRFKLALDIENFVEKLNGKEGEDFKIIYLKGGPREEEQLPKTEKLSTTHVKVQDIREIQIKKKEKTQSGKNKEDGVPTRETKLEKDRVLIKEENLITKTNPYKLILGKSTTGIGMMVGTFPGDSRQEQLAILAEIYGIPIDNDLISIEHKNGNSWFTGYFEKEEERDYCIQKLEEINREIISQDKTAQTFAIHKIGEATKKTSSKGKETVKETVIQILDIPEDFTKNRIQGALKNYGTINKIHTYPGKRNNTKSATVSFNNCKLDLDQTWAIPMGQTMARIAPIQANEEVFNCRNQFTARLYGIRPQSSATRIMSAIKHTGAKTVYIPLNSKTGKRRNFAIIGFQDNTNLEKAITQYIHLFGCKTWWSTKDNTKALQKRQNKRKEWSQHTRSDTYQESDLEPDQNSDSELDKYEEDSKNQHRKSYTSHSNSKQKNTKERKSRDYQSHNITNNIDDMFNQLTRQLSLLNNRLENLESHKEKNNKYRKEVRARPNLS
jgi:RNA recognition motif-containing protein